MTTETDAYKEMCAALRTIVSSANVLAIVGYAPQIRYVDVPYPVSPPKDKIWLRISIMQGGEKKRTLSIPSRITYQGVCDVQQFVPVTEPKAAEVGRKLADALFAVYTRSTASVDFYSAAIRDMPQDDAWYYKRINATYNFDNYV